MDTAQKETLDMLIASLPITYSASFVAQSRSRNAGEKNLSLNWEVTIARKDYPASKITTDYMQGMGHAPDYNACGSETRKVYADKHFRAMAENGKYNTVKRKLSNGNSDWYATFESSFAIMKAIPAPALKDILYSLIMDSDVLNYTGFEDWADNTGYEVDSRKAEKIYQDCLDIALKLKAILGNETIGALQVAFQDY